MNISKRMTAMAVALTAALAGCGDNVPVGPHVNAHQVGEDLSAGSISGGGINLFGGGGGGGKATSGTDSGIGVNAYLWRGTLDTLKFMPLASADPFGGVIITDWWTPPAAPGERFKATAYILGRQLRADAIHVSLFRQVLQNGQWIDAAVDPSKPTDLENMVLAKARDLRAQSAATP